MMAADLSAAADDIGVAVVDVAAAAVVVADVEAGFLLHRQV